MMRYLSDLRIHCIKDEGKKKLTVIFTTAHSSISHHKIIIKKYKQMKKT